MALLNFPSPHCHQQSLDTASTPEAFAEREIELGTGTLTCTDHGTMGACNEIVGLAKKKNLIAIPGLEGYVRDDDCPILLGAGIKKNAKGTLADYNKYYHITLHAMDNDGYEAMVRALSKADFRAEQHGSERKPLFTWSDIEELGGYNVTMTSGCLIGMVQRHLMANRPDLAQAYYEKLRSIPKAGNFYVEVFPHKCDTNWVSGIFLTLEGGEKLKFWKQKKLKTTLGEFAAEDLAKLCSRGKPLGSLVALRNYSSWDEREPKAILEAKLVEGFMPNECTPFAPDGDVQLGANRFVLEAAKKYGDKVLISDDCLVAGTLIRTEHGYTPIEHVTPGTKVLSRLGAWDTVEATRGLFTSKRLITLKGRGWELTATEDHRLWVRPGLKWENGGYRQDFNEPEWIAAQDVTPGSWVFTAKPPAADGAAMPPIDLASFYTHNNSKYLEVGEKTIRSQSRVTKVVAEFSRWVEWDADFAFIVGLFLGDGNAHNNLVGFAIDRESWTTIAERLTGFCARYGFHFDKKENPGHITFRIVCGPLAQFFRRTFYSNKTKVPGLASGLTADLRWSLISGLLWADGTNRNGTNCDGKVNLSMTSLPVISWVREFCLSQGVWTSFGCRIPPGGVLPLYTIDFDHNLFQFVTIWKTGGKEPLKAHKKYTTDGYWFRVKSVSVAERQDVPVYDLQVSGDSSFSTTHVTVHNCHFALPEEKIVQDSRLGGAGGSWRFQNSYHRMSSEEAFGYFKNVMGIDQATYEGWVDNNLEWSRRFKDFKFVERKSLPTKFYPQNTLEHLKVLIDKHGRMDWGNPEWMKRLGSEIDLLYKNGTIDLLPYFFLAEEVTHLYEKNKMLTGPGRGSAAGLLTTYLLGITHVEPLRYGLSQDRFLTKDRIASGKLPDIDLDFSDRDLLVDPEKGWLYQRFGDHVAAISTNTMLRLKSSIKDVARSTHGYVDSDIEALCRKIPNPPQGVDDADFIFGYTGDDGKEVKGFLDESKELQEYTKARAKEWAIVKKMLGITRNKSRHACAMVIANEPVSNFIPLITISGIRTTQYTAGSVEERGGLKMDFLGLNSLKDIQGAIKLIQERNGVIIEQDHTVDAKRVPGIRLVPHKGQLFDIWNLPEDQSVFRDIAEGDTETVFQLNTNSAKQWLRQFNYEKSPGVKAIDSIEAVAAFTALDRPGPLDAEVRNEKTGKAHNMLVEYANRAKGLPKTGAIPALDAMLPETYGVMCIAEGSRVKTSKGLVPIEAVNQGDMVQTETGEYRTVLALLDQGSKEVIEVRINNGEALRLTADHRVLTSRGWIEAGLLEKTDLIKQFWTSDAHIEEGDDRDWVVGLILADGDICAGTITVTCSSEEFANQVKVIADKAWGLKSVVRYGSTAWVCSLRSNEIRGQNYKNPLKEHLRALGLLGSDCYRKRMPSNITVSMLAGFFEGDGCVANGRVRLCNELLARDFFDGLQAARVRSSFYKDSDGAWTVSVQGDLPLRIKSPRARVRRNNDYVPVPDCVVPRSDDDRQLLRNKILGRQVAERLTKYGGVVSDDMWGKVVSIRKLPDVKRVFDLSVDGVHSFVVGGSVVHNCYQEQVEKMYRTLTGCDGIEAGKFRTSIAKKKMDEVKAAYPKFMERASEKIGRDQAQLVWDQTVSFAQYAFNKSHAVCYSVIAYACAYLKHHFPLEWWCAVLRNADKKEAGEKFWKYCKQWVDLPDITHSGDEFEIRDNRIKTPLSFVNGVGPGAHKELTAGRPYANIEEFCNKIQRYKLSKKTPTLLPDGTQKTDKKGNLVFKMGTSALNTGVVSKLIVAGVMDSLFPSGTSTLDKLERYQNALDDSSNQILGKKNTTKVDPKFTNLHALSRYQMQKGILPVFSADLTGMLIDLGYTGISKVHGEASYYPEGAVAQDVTNQKGGRPLKEAVRVVNGAQLKYLNEVELGEGEIFTVAAPAYVLAERRFNYQNNTRTAIDLTLDIDGEQFSFVKWPDRKTGELVAPEQELTGALVLALLTRYRSDRPFTMDAVVVVQQPLTDSTEEAE